MPCPFFPKPILISSFERPPDQDHVARPTRVISRGCEIVAQHQLAAAILLALRLSNAEIQTVGLVDQVCFPRLMMF